MDQKYPSIACHLGFLVSDQLLILQYEPILFPSPPQAARNCLVTEKNVVKVCDFGMTRLDLPLSVAIISVGKKAPSRAEADDALTLCSLPDTCWTTSTPVPWARSFL